VKTGLLIIFSLLTLVLTGCVPRPVYKLEALDLKDYYKGREIVTKEADSTKVSVQVDSYDGGKVMFYVQIENNSNYKVFIEPNDIYVDKVSEDLVPVDTIYQRYYADDPEKELNKINQDMEGRKSAHSFLTGVNAVIAFISVAADLSNKNDKHKADHVGDDINNWANNQTDENINYDNSLNNLDSKKEYWENQVLRKTDLYPNEQVGGIVVVSTEPDADYLELTLPVQSTLYNFFFKKVRIE
jgi:hypothetical protein